jgi:hypothetical protein
LTEESYFGVCKMFFQFRNGRYQLAPNGPGIPVSHSAILAWFPSGIGLFQVDHTGNLVQENVVEGIYSMTDYVNRFDVIRVVDEPHIAEHRFECLIRYHLPISRYSNFPFHIYYDMIRPAEEMVDPVVELLTDDSILDAAVVDQPSRRTVYLYDVRTGQRVDLVDYPLNFLSTRQETMVFPLNEQNFQFEDLVRRYGNQELPEVLPVPGAQLPVAVHPQIPRSDTPVEEFQNSMIRRVQEGAPASEIQDRVRNFITGQPRQESSLVTSGSSRSLRDRLQPGRFDLPMSDYTSRLTPLTQAIGRAWRGEEPLRVFVYDQTSTQDYYPRSIRDYYQEPRALHPIISPGIFSIDMYSTVRNTSLTTYMPTSSVSFSTSSIEPTGRPQTVIPKPPTAPSIDFEQVARFEADNLIVRVDSVEDGQIVTLVDGRRFFLPQ